MADIQMTEIFMYSLGQIYLPEALMKCFHRDRHRCHGRRYLVDPDTDK